jgi:opacity protein-like surface antigen
MTEVGIMKKVITALVVLLFCTAGTAHAIQGFYIAPKIGYSLLNFDDPELGLATLSDEDDDVLGAGLALGYDMGRLWVLPLRVEVEGFVRERGSETWAAVAGFGEVRNSATVGTLFANAYFDLPLAWRFRPYVGGGVGMAWVDYRTTITEPIETTSEDDRTNFAWNLGGGVAFGLTPTILIDLAYRYVDAGTGRTTFEIADVDVARSEADIFLHEFLVGLRLTF